MRSAASVKVKGSLPTSGARRFEEVIGEQGDVLAPLAQRWNSDLDHVQPVEEILAEPALSHRLLQVRVGGRDQAHVDANLL